MSADKTVLLVEDNPSILLLMERALAPEGYTVLSAADAEGALALVGGAGRRIDLLVSDLVLPGVGGLELARRVSALDPALRVLLISGYAGQATAAAARVAFLEKPFSAASFRAAVRELLAAPGSS